MGTRGREARQGRIAVLLVVLAAAVFPAPGVAQERTEVKGEAILKHPIGQLALKLADLLLAGKIDEVIRLRTKSEQSDWKATSANERQQMAELMKKRAPETAAFEKAIRASGVISIGTVDGTTDARLKADIGNDSVMAFFELEGGQWRSTTGPMLIVDANRQTNEVRFHGAEILKHPIAAVAMQYVDLVHAGKMEEAMRLATADAQKRWKAEPASERAESAAFRKKMLPTRAEISAVITNGGILIVEDETRATLNIIKIEQRSSTPGVVSSSSTTVAIGFALEDGQWKVAQ